MLKKITISTLSIVLFSMLVIAFLYLTTDQPIRYNQNFTRVFNSNFLQEKSVLNIKEDWYYIAGLTADYVFLGNKKNTLNVLTINSSLTDTLHINILAEKSDNIKLENSYLQVDSPFFYIKDGNTPFLYRGNLWQWNARPHLKHYPPFSQAVPISSNSLIIQTIVGTEGSELIENTIGKIAIDSPYIRLNSTLLERQIDGYYSTAGTLRYSKSLNYVIYTYLFRNLYIVLDTNLNLVYKGNTIDSVSHVKIKPIEIDKSSFTLASPNALVNNNSQISEKWLFVHSNLMAKNETKKIFENASVIDVYDITNHQYKFSFYLNNYRQQKMTDFKINQDRLFAIYGNNIVRYNINKEYFNKVLSTKL